MALVTTPSGLEAFLQQTNRSALTLYDDMVRASEASEDNARLLAAYEKWINDVWGPFFRDNTGVIGSLTGSAFSGTSERALALQQELIDFRTEFERIGGEATGPAVTPPSANEDLIKFAKTMGILIVIGLGLYLAIKAFSALTSGRRLREPNATR